MINVPVEKPLGRLVLKCVPKTAERCKDAMAQNILVFFFLWNLPQRLIEKSRKTELFNQGSLINNLFNYVRRTGIPGRTCTSNQEICNFLIIPEKINTFLQLFRNMIAFSSFLPRQATIGHNRLHLDIRIYKVPCVGGGQELLCVSQAGCS